MPFQQTVFSTFLHPRHSDFSIRCRRAIFLKTVWLMQNHLFDLQPGESVLLGDYSVTLLEIEDEAAVLEIQGPDGGVQMEPINFAAMEKEEELAVLV